MVKAGRQLHPDDAAPPLGWEYAIWWLYTQVETQWRYSFNGREGLDYGPVIAIAKELRWPLTSTLGYLKVIECTAKDCWDEQRRASQG